MRRNYFVRGLCALVAGCMVMALVVLPVAIVYADDYVSISQFNIGESGEACD